MEVFIEKSFQTMKRKVLYKIINEEIGTFDFLGNSAIQNELSHEQIVSSKEFQTQLVHALLTDTSVIINATYLSKDSNLGDEYPAIIELELEIEFPYNDKKFNLILLLEGEENNDKGVDYDSFNMKLFSKGGEEINIDWVKKSNLYPKLIYSLLLPYT